MFYVVQENVFREENYNIIFSTLNRLGLEYEVVKVADVLEAETQRKDVFAFGSVKMARLSTEMGWSPGSLYGGNHDYEIYAAHYGENMLNSDCQIVDIDHEIEWMPNEIKFIRPCKDSKLFNGKLYSHVKWTDTKGSVFEYLLDQYHCIPEVSIQVGPIKKIYKEARVWIVDGKVITSSWYRFGENVTWSENVDPDGLEFAQTMVDVYQVAPAFVMDICLTPDGWKIVEINCINCAGFYRGDLQKVIIALENLYNPIT
jgi:hypothetical protein